MSKAQDLLNLISEDSAASEDDLKKLVLDIKQQMTTKGTVRIETGIEQYGGTLGSQYMNIISHGITHGTNTMGWRDQVTALKKSGRLK